MSITLAQLRMQAQQRCDMVNSNFITNAEWNYYLSDSYKELYDILVSKMADYYTLDPIIFTLGGNATSYILPADFYKLRGVSMASGAQTPGDVWIPLHPFNFEQRDDLGRSRSLYGLVPTLRYRVYRNSLIFTPPEQAPNTVLKMWYIPTPSSLVLDTDIIDGVAGWEEYVVVDACIKALTKEESDITVYMMQKQSMKERIEMMALNRDAGECESVTDRSRIGIQELYTYR